MKYRLSFIFLCFSLTCFAQDTVYYKNPRLRVATFEACDYFAIITQNGNKLTETDYTRPDMWRSEKHYVIDQNKKIKTGNWKVWYADGNLRRNIRYEKGKLNDSLLTYWSNGAIKRRDFYKNDVLVDGACYDSLGNQLTHFPYETKAQFPGGEKAFYRFLKRTIYYPQTSGPVSGTVQARFLITHTGAIKDIQILNQPYEPMKNEVLRVLKKMPEWEPARLDGEAIDSYYTFPVNFIAN